MKGLLSGEERKISKNRKSNPHTIIIIIKHTRDPLWHTEAMVSHYSKTADLLQTPLHLRKNEWFLS